LSSTNIKEFGIVLVVKSIDPSNEIMFFTVANATSSVINCPLDIFNSAIKFDTSLFILDVNV
jgi:hypothetical protein